MEHCLFTPIFHFLIVCLTLGQGQIGGKTLATHLSDKKMKLSTESPTVVPHQTIRAERNQGVGWCGRGYGAHCTGWWLSPRTATISALQVALCLPHCHTATLHSTLQVALCLPPLHCTAATCGAFDTTWRHCPRCLSSSWICCLGHRCCSVVLLVVSIVIVVIFGCRAGHQVVPLKLQPCLEYIQGDFFTATK